MFKFTDKRISNIISILKVSILAAFLNVTPVLASTDSLMLRMLTISEQARTEEPKALYKEWTEFQERLIKNTERRGSDRAKIRYLHQELQGSKYFKTYEHGADFYEMLKYGKYNCVTAVLLYGKVFQKLNITFSVGEMPHHVYLVAETREGNYLLVDGTSKHSGLVFGFESIKHRVEEYRRVFSVPYNENEAAVYRSEHTISYEQFLGLAYYQKAVKNFNLKKYRTALHLLDEAYGYYRSKRISELILLSLAYLIESRQNNEFSEQHLWKKYYKRRKLLQKTVFQTQSFPWSLILLKQPLTSVDMSL
jgi:hypothetical protein